MAGTLFQDNLSPYLTAVEQGSTPATPGAGNQKLFIRSSDHLLCYVNSSGTVTAVGSGFANPMTTKGDIIIGDTGGSPIRKAVGSDTQVLTADSASTGGIKWAAAGGGVTPLGAGSIVNTKTYATCSSGVSISLGFTPTNGNILLGYVTTNTGTAIAITTTNVTWTLAARSAYFSGNQQICDIWLGVVAGSPGNTATITFTGASAQGAAFEEFSGLSTIDSAEAWLNRTSTTSFQEQYHTFPWPTPGGRVVCVFGNSQGNAIAVPTGWTRNIAAGSYGGTASASILTIDASASATYARTINVAPVANDVHLGVFVHLIP